MMARRILLSSGFLAAVFGLSACGTLPAAGPSVATLRGANAVHLVDVTIPIAQARAQAVTVEHRRRTDETLHELMATYHEPQFVFAVGDRLRLSLWSVSPWSGIQGPSPTPSAMDLGTYTISQDGTIAPPYIGPVHLAGLSIDSAQRAVASEYGARGVLQAPSAKITLVASPHNGISVTGDVGSPKVVPWTPSGLSLAQAVTEAMGGSADPLGAANTAGSKTASIVTVQRDTHRYSLPLAVALESPVMLEPDDRVIVARESRVQVTVVGGGVPRNGQFGFGHVPTVAEVLASAGGLNSATANDHAVFVMEQKARGVKPDLYDFAWNRAQGLVASSSFPVENGDVVYVAEAPIVKIQQVVNLLFQIVVPVNTIVPANSAF